MVIRSCMVRYSLVLIIEARRPRPFIDTNRNYRVRGTRPLMIEQVKSMPFLTMLMLISYLGCCVAY